MTFPKARLIASLCVFLAWLGFLAFLVSERKSVILSGPQFAIADAFIIAQVHAIKERASATVDVKEIAWAEPGVDRAKLKKLELPELVTTGKAYGYSGSGLYIVPIVKKSTYFEIAPIRTPGYTRAYSHASLYLRGGGKHPEAVLVRLTRHARERPEETHGWADPLIVPAVECLASRSLLPDVEPVINLAGIDLPRRLPIGAARALQEDLMKLGADVRLYPDELRIYLDTPETRSQLDDIIKAKR